MEQNLKTAAETYAQYIYNNASDLNQCRI